MTEVRAEPVPDLMAWLVREQSLEGRVLQALGEIWAPAQALRPEIPGPWDRNRYEESLGALGRAWQAMEHALAGVPPDGDAATTDVLATVESALAEVAEAIAVASIGSGAPGGFDGIVRRAMDDLNSSSGLDGDLLTTVQELSSCRRSLQHASALHAKVRSVAETMAAERGSEARLVETAFPDELIQTATTLLDAYGSRINLNGTYTQ
jgi:hypothetical protein